MELWCDKSFEIKLNSFEKNGLLQDQIVDCLGEIEKIIIKLLETHPILAIKFNCTYKLLSNNSKTDKVRFMLAKPMLVARKDQCLFRYSENLLYEFLWNVIYETLQNHNTGTVYIFQFSASDISSPNHL